MEMDSPTRSSGNQDEETRGEAKMEEDDSSKHSPELDLNQAVATEIEEEGKGEVALDHTQQLWRVEEGIAEETVSVSPEEAVMVLEEKPASEEVAVKGPEEKLSSPAGDGSPSPCPPSPAEKRSRSPAGDGSPSPCPPSPAEKRSRSPTGEGSSSPSPPSPAQKRSRPPARNGSPRPPSPDNIKAASASPADNNNTASPSVRRESKSPSPSPRTRPSPLPRSKDSPVSAGRSRSPSSKKRRSLASSRRSMSRSPDGRHGRGRDDGKRRHDRSRSPVERSRGRERHGRSHSKSPYERDRYRSRYSPRRRSSPPRYQSRRDRSPRRRPWSPPPNRNTGVGKPGNNLFVAGFSFVTTERDLEKKFSRYGRVTDVRIIRDRRSGDSRGFGFLSLERDEDADAAIRALDQTEWNGRIVLVEKAKTN